MICLVCDEWYSPLIAAENALLYWSLGDYADATGGWFLVFHFLFFFNFAFYLPVTGAWKSTDLGDRGADWKTWRPEDSEALGNSGEDITSLPGQRVAETEVSVCVCVRICAGPIRLSKYEFCKVFQFEHSLFFPSYFMRPVHEAQAAGEEEAAAEGGCEQESQKWKKILHGHKKAAHRYTLIHGYSERKGRA